MRVFKRGKKFYSYEFEFAGRRYKKSTRCTNQSDALGIAAAHRLNLANASAGVQVAKQEVPTLREFRQQFLDWLNGECEKPRTREYYAQNMDKLLAFAALADLRLDEIKPPIIDRFKTWALKTFENHSHEPICKDSVNRYLGTLRRALRYAHYRLLLIPSVPMIQMYRVEDDGRQHVLSAEEYDRWLHSCPEPLRSASILARNTGICRSELLALQKDSVTLSDAPDARGFYGEIKVERGLKRKVRRRVLKVNHQVFCVLSKLMNQSKCDHVFTDPENPGMPLRKTRLNNQMQQMKKEGHFHKEAGLHALRHTFLTEMAKHTDAFTLQRIAGHADISTTMRYVHPQREAVELAFQSLNAS